MQLGQLFFHMLTLEAMAYLNVTNCYGSDLNVSMNQSLITTPYVLYIRPVGECTTMLGQSKNGSSL